MLIIPAIDIKDGCVVRLMKGDFSRIKVYSKDPVKAAKHWMRQGAGLIHVVDLDGAATGTPGNLEYVKQIAGLPSASIQFGGGVRSISMVERLIKLGVTRVIIGTKAAEDPDFLAKALSSFKEKIIVSVDSRDNKVMTRGWKYSKGGGDTLKFCRHLKSKGVSQFIYTNIAKDGTLKGPDVAGIKNLLKLQVKIIASGGISSLEDIRRLKPLEKKGLSGIIIGKALYEGKFTLTQALRVAN